MPRSATLQYMQFLATCVAWGGSGTASQTEMSDGRITGTRQTATCQSCRVGDKDILLAQNVDLARLQATPWVRQSQPGVREAIRRKPRGDWAICAGRWKKTLGQRSSFIKEVPNKAGATGTECQGYLLVGYIYRYINI